MKQLLIPVLAILLFACGGEQETETTDGTIQEEAQAFLDEYNSMFQQLLAESNEAEWQANTYIVDGDTATENWVTRANEALAAFTGSEENIEQAKHFLESAGELNDLQVRQLNNILYKAGSNPATAGEIVSQRIAAEQAQNNKLFSFDFTINGNPVSPNEIDSILKHSNNPAERLLAWEASKAVGIELKEGLANLKELRNASVQALGYDDFFQYQVSDYGMESEEMIALCQDMVNDIWPLYRELHTWARYTLAEKYDTEVPELLPAHWLPNR